MNYSKKFLGLLIMLFVPFGAHAQWSGGVGYNVVSVDDLDLDLDMISTSLAYDFGGSDGFSNQVQVKLGTAASDDTVLGVNVELSRFVQFAYRPEFALSDAIYIYGLVSYTDVSVTLSSGIDSESVGSEDFGAGVGFGFTFTESLGAEFSYESIEDVNVVSVGLTLDF